MWVSGMSVGGGVLISQKYKKYNRKCGHLGQPLVVGVLISQKYEKYNRKCGIWDGRLWWEC